MTAVALPAPLTYEQPKQTETRLLTSIAAEYNTAANQSLTWDGLRWWKIGTPARAIWVVTRGANPVKVANISASKTPELWASWQPVLAALAAEHANKKRVNHDKIAKGKL